MCKEPGRPIRPEPHSHGRRPTPPRARVLMEMLARNAHESLGVARPAQGWTWGPRRDDARKEHPCLIPYEHLVDSEKDYYCAAALETIKAILALGFCISRPVPPH